MLNDGGARRRRHVLLSVLALVVAAITMHASPAAAVEVPPGCTLVTYMDGDKRAYRVDCPATDPDPGGGGSDSGEETCERDRPSEYCIGEAVCWANVPSAQDPDTWPEETRPSPEAIYTYQNCTPDPDGSLSGWSWYEPPGPSLAELATQAYGALAPPAFSLGFNPPGQAVVGIDTWFWADTGSTGTITGSSAAGVVAVGRPDALEVDPGDGSGVRSCPWSVTAEATCAYDYPRSSVHGTAVAAGQPAYPARMRLVYDVHFELDGAPLTLPGLPTTFTSPWQTASVPVVEVQSVVTSRS